MSASNTRCTAFSIEFFIHYISQNGFSSIWRYSTLESLKYPYICPFSIELMVFHKCYCRIWKLVSLFRLLIKMQRIDMEWTAISNAVNVFIVNDLHVYFECRTIFFWRQNGNAFHRKICWKSHDFPPFEKRFFSIGSDHYWNELRSFGTKLRSREKRTHLEYSKKSNFKYQKFSFIFDI